MTNEDTSVAVDPLANDDVGAGAALVTVNNVPDPDTEGTFTYTDDGTGLLVAVSATDELSPAEAATLLFNPVEDFNGVVTTVAYTVTDVNGETSDADIDITVTPTPDAVDDMFSGNEDTPVALDPLSNDDLVAGADSVQILNIPDSVTEGTLTYVDDLTGNMFTVAAGTILSPAEAASLSFTPVADFNGQVTRIGYEVTDVNGETSQAVIDINIIPTPDAVDDVNATAVNTPVSGNVIDNDTSFVGENLMVSEVNGVPIGNGPIVTEFGTVDIAADGTYTFTPLPGLSEPATFTYTVVDENGVESEATVVIDIADIGLAKSVVEAPTLLANGNFRVTYQLVVQNNGSLNLGDLSLVEDLATQFGGGFVSAGGLRITDPAAAVGSAVTLDSSWNGDGLTEMVAAGSTLVAGDSFTLAFDVIVDASGFDPTATTENSVAASAVAVDENGDSILNANGDPVLVNDLSDSGIDPAGDNPNEPGDALGSDDPTPLNIPSIGLAKLAGDAVANGSNFDVTFTLAFENNGTVDLTNLTLIDDIASQFGDAFVSVSGVSVENFVGSGTAPVINSDWVNDTSQTIISGGTANVGDTFDVVFSVTVNPDLATGAIDNSATAGGEALDANGRPLTDGFGNPITASDVSDNGADPNAENGEEVTGDGVFANDPTPLLIADLGLAKSVVGEPVFTETGNSVVTFQLVVQNTGTVDLGSLSLLEDIAGQFGSPFVDAGNLVLASAPSDPGSSIAVDSAGFNGSSVIEIIDTSAPNVLVVGDSFTVTFDVEINPALATEPLENSVTGSGGAIDENGDAILDSNGNQIAANDLSDSGVDPITTNPGGPDDQGTSDDPTVVDPTPAPTGQISGVVFEDSNNDGIQQASEAGIAAVEIVLTGTDVLGNSVTRTVLTDANGVYTFTQLQAGSFTVTQTQPEGFSDGIDVNASGTVAPINDVLGNITLGFGETINTGTFGEQRSGASGNPPQFSAFGPLAFNRLSNLANGFVSNSGTIYSGIPINGNTDPLSLESGRPVTGGFALPAEELASDDSGCGEIDPYGNAIPIEQIIDDGSGCGPVSPQGQVIYEDVTVEETVIVPEDAESVSESTAAEGEASASNVVDQIDSDRAEEMAANEGALQKPSLLKRLSIWLNV